MQFLILHKVRGEPAFDIAEPAKIGDEEGWVLCTCGHRAYPFKTWRLIDILQPNDIQDIPKDWPDHYTVRREPDPISISTFLSSLSKFVRRI